MIASAATRGNVVTAACAIKILFRQIGKASLRFSSLSTSWCSRSIRGRDQSRIWSLLFLFALFDQLPEAGVLLQLFVFSDRQLRTQKKIANSIFVQDPVHQDTLAVPLKIDTVIVSAITIKTFSFPLDDAKRL